MTDTRVQDRAPRLLEPVLTLVPPPRSRPTAHRWHRFEARDPLSTYIRTRRQQLGRRRAPSRARSTHWVGPHTQQINRTHSSKEKEAMQAFHRAAPPLNHGDCCRHQPDMIHLSLNLTVVVVRGTVRRGGLGQCDWVGRGGAEGEFRTSPHMCCMRVVSSRPIVRA